LQRLADRHGFPHAIIAKCDLTAPDVATQLDRHGEYRNLRGVRGVASGAALRSAELGRGITALTRRGLLYELQITHESMGYASAVARRHPATTFVLEHAGLPLRADPGYLGLWRSGLRELGRLPNVLAKVSGLGMARHDWSIGSVRGLVLAVIDAFGTERTFFGSNWPVDRLYSDYGAIVGAHRAIVHDFTTAEQERLLHLNARQHYRL